MAAQIPPGDVTQLARFEAKYATRPGPYVWDETRGNLRRNKEMKKQSERPVKLRQLLKVEGSTCKLSKCCFLIDLTG